MFWLGNMLTVPAKHSNSLKNLPGQEIPAHTGQSFAVCCLRCVSASLSWPPFRMRPWSLDAWKRRFEKTLLKIPKQAALQLWLLGAQQKKLSFFLSELIEIDSSRDLFEFLVHGEIYWCV